MARVEIKSNDGSRIGVISGGDDWWVAKPDWYKLMEYGPFKTMELAESELRRKRKNYLVRCKDEKEFEKQMAKQGWIKS